MIPRRVLEDELRSIVNQLVHRYRPQKVILFGSLAAVGDA